MSPSCKAGSIDGMYDAWACGFGAARGAGVWSAAWGGLDVMDAERLSIDDVDGRDLCCVERIVSVDPQSLVLDNSSVCGLWSDKLGRRLAGDARHIIRLPGG